MIRIWVSELLAVAVGIGCLYLWAVAIAHDYKRNEPLLSAAWVICPPCGVVRGGYLIL
jgi:hypothetical protein